MLSLTIKAVKPCRSALCRPLPVFIRQVGTALWGGVKPLRKEFSMRDPIKKAFRIVELVVLLKILKVISLILS